MDLDIFSVLSSGELEEFNVEGEDEVLVPKKIPKHQLPHEVHEYPKNLLEFGELVDKFNPTGLKLALVKCGGGKCEKYGAIFWGTNR